MVEYIRSDLEAILFHIKIAEAHAAGQPLYGPGGLIPTYNLSWGLRTVDGSYNNLLPGREYWGAADQPFTTHMDPAYRTFMVDPDGAGPSGPVLMSYAPTLVDPDGSGRAVAGDVLDPALRTISNLIVDQTLANPAAIMESMRRDGIQGDLLAIALTIKAAYEAVEPTSEAAAAAQIAETAALAVLATETAEQAAAADAASALAAADAAVAQDVLDLAAATAASDAADAAEAEAKTAYDAAVATLAAYVAALAQDVEVSAGLASSATSALLTSLGSAADPLDAADHQAVSDAIAAATTASSAAAVAHAALQAPGVAQADLDAAAAAAASAAGLVTQLTALQSALQVDDTLDASELTDANTARDTATTSEGLANAWTDGMVNVGLPAAQASADLAQDDLAAASANAVDMQALEDAAAADLVASQATQAAAAGDDAALQTALATANAELAAAQVAAASATAASVAADGAAALAAEDLAGLLTTYGIELSGDNVVLPAVATDEGLSAPFNSWFTLFGQFFDHGLDLVNKGGSGTVFIPLAHDDPLYDAGPDGIAGNGDDARTNFMVMTRATTTPGPDGVFGTADDVRPLNTTTPFVDQNQTYSSHPSHQVFLREYAMTTGGPEATGHLIEGANGGMANWGELKEYTRTNLGIELTDQDVGMVPLLRTDAYGNFIPGANGFPQVITGVGPDGIPNTADDVVIEGDPSANGGKGISLDLAIRTNSAFLADIAHNAVPNGLADGDITVGLDNGGGSQTDGIYDNELLDKHFIAGDGRVNENIGLITVHHIFHAEHNRMVDHTKQVILATADPAFIAEWLVPGADQSNGVQAHEWNGERLFQAAKFGTEMQYQHLVFEEFARKVQPSINAFIVPDGYDATINPSIMAEFAHVVYRFGHSMLTETVDRYDANFTPDHISLIEAFLNPVAFDENGTVLDGIAAGDIIRGMTRQVGNQIDEFVTSALRDNLLGLPLDLATINLARGRDTGVPSLNAARREFYEVTNGNAALRPYDSWVDFAAHLKNEASIINFVAAYGTHALITSQTTTEGRRDAALTIITGNSYGGLVVPSDATDFLNATGAYAGGKLGGLDDVDLWIGGLAEQTMPFGGMLGSTFNFVFEVQMESLQNADRFYYLQRNTGQHLFEQLEANSFASMIMRHTDATHLPGDVFSTPGLILEVDQSKQFNDLNGDGTLESDDPTSENLLTELVIRDNPATPAPDSNYLRYTGGDHVVLGGTDNNDTLIAGIGDDTIHGDAGNDRIEGGFGNDEIRGGDGDDIITDMGGDDTLKGGKGNDAINGGSGIDLVLAGDGNDFVVMGSDGDGGAFGGLGNDFMLMNLNSLPAFGNEGDDWIEDGANAGMFGDNLDDGFARDAIRGNDVMVGVGGGFDEYVGEGGDDIMVGSLGSAKHAGMSGFDWVTYKNLTAGIDASLLDGFLFDEAPLDPADIAIQRFESVEGLSGSRFDDRLVGSNFTAVDRIAGTADGGFRGSFLDAQGIALIDGLQDLLGAGVTSYDAGDILLGGDGNDEIVGGGGNDIIDGDKWLNVRISVRANRDGTGPEIGTADSMTQLTARIFSGEINPGQLVIVREILTADGEGDIDTAAYSGLLADYDIEGRTVDAIGVQLTSARDVNGDGFISVSDTVGADGTDLLKNIEQLKFADQILVISAPGLAQPPALDLNASGLVTTTIQFRDQFDTPAFNNSNGTTLWTAPWVETGDNNVATTGQIRIDANDNNQLRFVGGTTAAFDGASISRAVDLSSTAPTTLTYSLGYTNVDPGDTLRVEFAANGTDFILLREHTATAIDQSVVLASFTNTVTGSANSVLRFTVGSLTGTERFNIDNVNLVSTAATQVPDSDGTGFTSTFTEGGAATAIASNPAITDSDSASMVGAQIRLTNAQSDDLLSIAGALPVGITSSFGPIVAGEITLLLSGTASLANYQTAIQQVRFSNTSQNPVVTPRVVEVTVNDGQATSPAAVATVNVVAVNDAPVAVADTILTNVSSGPIVIPEWALLANDTDADGNVLDVTAVSAEAGVTGLSLTTNPGSVTLSDDATPGGSFVYTASDGAATSNATVTLTSQGTGTGTGTGTVQVADNFNGVNRATRSAADNSTGTVPWTTSWTESDDDGNIRTGQIQIDGGPNAGTNQLRFINGDGASITRAVDLSGASTATLTLNFDKNGIDAGESVQVQFAADGTNFVTLDTITNTGGNGGAAGTLSLGLPGALGANSAIRFLGSAISAAGEDIRIDNVAIAYASAPASVSGTITGTAAGEILVGNDAGTIFNGLGGNDRIFAGGGDDTVNWSVGDGRDFVDGGANGVIGDRFIVNGDDTVENYIVYARADAIAAGITGLNAATEIVITRNGTGNVVAELDNVEEITINTAGGADIVAAVGDFGPTSLFFNTVTVNGGPNATIDASRLTSAHRLVLNQDGTTSEVQVAPVGDQFEGIGRSMLDWLARNGQMKLDDDGFVGSRHHGMFAATLLASDDQRGWLPSNPVFDSEAGGDFAPNDYGQSMKTYHQALHFGAADYLIS